MSGIEKKITSESDGKKSSKDEMPDIVYIYDDDFENCINLGLIRKNLTDMGKRINFGSMPNVL